MPKVKRNHIKYSESRELIEPTLLELDAKMRGAGNDPHGGKRKCGLWPIFKIAHQRSIYIYDLYYGRNEISKELYELCLEQGYADRNLIVKWKKVIASGNIRIKILSNSIPTLWKHGALINGSTFPEATFRLHCRFLLWFFSCSYC